MGEATQSATKRLQQELMNLMMAQVAGISAFPEGDNLFHWVGTIGGPEGTPYAGLSYRINMRFPEDYPFGPPAIFFETPIFHPNVDEHGAICLDILKEKWSPVYNVQTILLSLQSLLGEPNNESPLNVHAATMWPDQDEEGLWARTAFRRTVRDRTSGPQV